MVTQCEGPPARVLTGEMVGLTEMYKALYQEKLILVLKYSVRSCSYYSSRFELKLLGDKDLLLLMLIHGLSIRDGSLSTLAASLASAPPSPFVHFTSADQVVWLTASRYCDERWIKSAAEQLEVIQKNKIVAIPHSMVDSIRLCSKIREKKDPPKLKEVLVSDILGCNVLQEVMKTINSVLQDKVKQAIDFSNSHSKYSSSYMERMVWSTESAYWRCQGLLLILFWSLIEDDAAVTCSTIDLLSTMGNDLLEVEDIVTWLANDFTFDLDEFTKAATVLQNLRDSAIINIPQSIINVFSSLLENSSLLTYNDIVWSQVDFPKEVGIPKVVANTHLLIQEEQSPSHIPSKEATMYAEIPPIEELPTDSPLNVEKATAEIPPVPGEKGFILVLGDRVPSSSESQSSLLDVIEISDDEADEKDQMYPAISRLHEKELVSKRILEKALEEQRKMLKEQENLMKGAIETLTKRLESTGELLSSKSIEKTKPNRPQKLEIFSLNQSTPVKTSRAKGSQKKSQEMSEKQIDKEGESSSVGQEVETSIKAVPESQAVSKRRRGRPSRSQQNETREHSLPPPQKQSPSKAKRRRGQLRRGSAPSVLENSPSSKTADENVGKAPDPKNIPEPKRNKGRPRTKK